MNKSQTTFNTTLLILVLLVVVIFGGLYVLTNDSRKTSNQVVGGDRDIQGCIGSAGYSWDETLQQCMRPWEESKGDDISNTETAPPGPPAYVNVQNTDERTGRNVISSPKYGESYVLGSYIPIKWDPELLDVSTAELVAVGQQGGAQIYRRPRLDDPVTMAAKIDYVLPSNLTVYPGRYRIRLSSYANKVSYMSDEFRIESPVPVLQRSDSKFNIGIISGANPSYSRGQTMKLNVEATEADGSMADASKGFNVQARLLDLNNVGVWSGNATYVGSAGLWHLDIPIMKDTYRVQVVLYCSNVNFDSYCMQKYGQNIQIERFINFMMEPQ